MQKPKGLKKANEWTYRELCMLAQYQFGEKFDEFLIPEGIMVTYSRSTGKVREVWFGDERLLSLRPTDGFFSLGLYGAKRIIENTKSPRQRVIIQTDVAEFIKEGRNVFAKHVVATDPTIRPADEVVVVSEEDELLAVGKALLSAKYMLAFQKGVGVKVRYGVKKIAEE